MKPTDTNQDEEFEPEFEPLVHQVGTGNGGSVLLAAGGAALGALVPPLSVPIAAGVAALEVLRGNLQKQQETRVEALLQAASVQASADPATLIARIVENDEYALLAAEAIDAARRTRLDSKAASLGRSLGSILKDDALIDRESIWIRILSVIEPPHIRALKYFVDSKKMKNGMNYWRPGLAVSVQTVSDGLKLDDAVLPLIQDLLRCGLLMNPGSMDGGTANGTFTPDSLSEELRATQLGAELFKRLERGVEGT
ncbi:hypothetical protein E8P82_10695 [Arthrobacter echini]|uniref:Uncharacterized protein n=1 Tax=Arthrobacter echini TaxID=1529066 RepID=A0A4S5E320_9MICC|nr:hypothetical protein [Arthrobacter echini]THJ65752.1 hypothetical protein E8P82_10695 [Arthrobacter echini]